LIRAPYSFNTKGGALGNGAAIDRLSVQEEADIFGHEWALLIGSGTFVSPTRAAETSPKGGRQPEARRLTMRLARAIRDP
jgi:hypothetical protein